MIMESCSIGGLYIVFLRTVASSQAILQLCDLGQIISLTLSPHI